MSIEINNIILTPYYDIFWKCKYLKTENVVVSIDEDIYYLPGCMDTFNGNGDKIPLGILSKHFLNEEPSIYKEFGEKELEKIGKELSKI